MDAFEDFFGELESSGLNLEAMDKIAADLSAAGGALGIAFVNDLASGAVTLPAPSDIAVDSTVDWGSKGKGANFHYKVSTGIVDFDITFDFPSTNPGISPSGNGYTLGLEDMHVNIGSLSASADSVDVSIDSGNDAILISMKAFLTLDGDDFVSAEVWTSGGDFIELDLTGSLQDGDIDVDGRAWGSITDVEANVYLEDGSDASVVNLEGANITVKMDADGVTSGSTSSSSGSTTSSTSSTSSSGSTTSSTSSTSSSGTTTSSTSSTSSSGSTTSSTSSTSSSGTTTSSTSSTSSSGSTSSTSSTSSSGIIAVDEVSAELIGNKSVAGDTLELLMPELEKLIDIAAFNNFFAGLEQSGLDLDTLNYITSDLSTVGGALGIAFVNDLASGAVTLDDASGVSVSSDVDWGSKGKDASFHYTVSHNSVNMEITFDFPDTNPGISPAGGGYTLSLEGMHVSIASLSASYNSMDISVEPADDAVIISLKASLVLDDQDFLSAELWTSGGNFMEMNISGSVKDDNVDVEAKAWGSIPDLSGDVFIDDSAPSSIAIEDADLKINMKKQ